MEDTGKHDGGRHDGVSQLFDGSHNVGTTRHPWPQDLILMTAFCFPSLFLISRFCSPIFKLFGRTHWFLFVSLSVLRLPRIHETHSNPSHRCKHMMTHDERKIRLGIRG